MLEIRWIKQKIRGFLVLILPFLFSVVIRDCRAEIVWLLIVPIGLYYMFSRDRIFFRDYILEIDIYKLMRRKRF